MFAIIGILAVFGAVVGGYLMEHGNLRVLLQPAELIIIGGAAIGTVLVANPMQGGGGARGHISGHLAVLRAGGAGSGQHGQRGGGRACLLSRTAGGHLVVSERDVADHGAGDGTAGDSRARTSVVPGSGEGAAGQRRRTGGCGGFRLRTVYGGRKTNHHHQEKARARGP